MSRPAKAISMCVGARAADTIAYREEAEEALRGGADGLVPPEWLNEGQRGIFEYVVSELADTRIMTNLDIFTLTHFAVAAERIFAADEELNGIGIGMEASLERRKVLMAERNSYSREFWKGVNELSLSPQARAKIGTLTLARKSEEQDPLKKLLAGKG